MSAHLLTQFHHNLWANLKLLDRCSGLDASILNDTDAGAFGTVLSTLAHIVNAESWYVWLLRGEPASVKRINAYEMSMSSLRDHVMQSGKALIELASTADDLAPMMDGTPVPAGIVLAQAAMHATEHRTNVTTILARHGIPKINVSVWEFYNPED